MTKESSPEKDDDDLSEPVDVNKPTQLSGFNSALQGMSAKDKALKPGSKVRALWIHNRDFNETRG